MDISGFPMPFSEASGDMPFGYADALVVFGISLVAFWALQRIVLAAFRRMAKRTKTDLDDMLVRVVDSFRPPFYGFLALYLSLRFVDFDPVVSRLFDVLIISWAAYQGVVAIQIILDYAVKRRLSADGIDDDPDAESAIRFVRNLARAALWVVAVLLVLSNLGINVTSLVAGLGIGGVAVAFALQNILGDLFSSFVIHFDKPFRIGDFIIVGEHMGTVERIGIKTTRLRALQGEEIVIANQEITSARVQNFRRMAERRVVHAIGVTYDTKAETMERIPGIIRDIVDPIDGVRFDRAHFSGFGSSSLDFEVVYFILSADYAEYMDLQEKINLAILRAFETEGVSFAFPSQTVYLSKGE